MGRGLMQLLAYLLCAMLSASGAGCDLLGSRKAAQPPAPKEPAVVSWDPEELQKYLVLELRTDKQEYSLGETIKFELIARNVGENALGWVTGCTLGHDVVVIDETVEPQECSSIWAYIRRIACAFKLTAWVVKPGEEIVMDAEWDQQTATYAECSEFVQPGQVRPGKYLAYGKIDYLDFGKTKALFLESPRIQFQIK